MVVVRCPRSGHHMTRTVLDDHLLSDLLADEAGTELTAILTERYPVTLSR